MLGLRPALLELGFQHRSQLIGRLLFFRRSVHLGELRARIDPHLPFQLLGGFADHETPPFLRLERLFFLAFAFFWGAAPSSAKFVPAVASCASASVASLRSL